MEKKLLIASICNIAEWQITNICKYLQIRYTWVMQYKDGWSSNCCLREIGDSNVCKLISLWLMFVWFSRESHLLNFMFGAVPFDEQILQNVKFSCGKVSNHSTRLSLDWLIPPEQFMALLLAQTHCHKSHSESLQKHQYSSEQKKTYLNISTFLCVPTSLDVLVINTYEYLHHEILVLWHIHIAGTKIN